MIPDLISIISWWFLFLVIGTVSIPSTWLFFKRFFDLGFGLTKIIGLSIIAFTCFITTFLHLAPFTQTVLSVIFFLYALLNFIIFKKHQSKITASISQNLKTILAQEILFSIGFIFWSWVRGHQPEIRGLEKFMDFGFINTILNSRYLPPIDMWFSGNYINYYWFGHFVVAVATKLSGINSSITYNLMIATILGLALTSSFSLITTLVKSISIKIGLKKIIFAGIISAILLCFGGNFHTPVYILKDGPENYWYPDATRFIGHNPETDDKTIHEFPMYSFVVSDLHAHLINLPFVLLYIALLWNCVSEEKKTRNPKFKVLNSNQSQNINIQNPKLFGSFGFKILNLFRISCLEIRNFQIIPLGFVLGIMFMTSAWDFGNYLLVTGVTLLLFNLRKNKISFTTIFSTAKSLALIFTLGVVTISPFLLNFTSISQGIKLTHTHSPLWQLTILWGFPAILTLALLFILTKSRVKFLKPDLFILSLHLASWALIILPEIVYLKDIYIPSHYRANTMFKLTYQAFVMFYLTSGYIFIRIISVIEGRIKKLVTLIGFTIIFSSLLIYPYYAIKSYYGELKNYQGLAGDRWLEQELSQQNKIITWLKQNVKGQPTILEAPGDSYTDFNVVSAYTGLPTVSGWFVHEWLWRGDSSFPQERVNDIAEIYTSADLKKTKSLLKKYKVEYVIIDNFVREKFPNLDETKIAQLGQEVFKITKAKIYKINL